MGSMGRRPLGGIVHFASAMRRTLVALAMIPLMVTMEKEGRWRCTMRMLELGSISIKRMVIRRRRRRRLARLAVMA